MKKHFPDRPFYKRHRGPYTLLLTRVNDDGEPESQWLKTRKPLKKGPEVEALASLHLENKHDTVTAVCVWSEKEEQFVMTFTERKRHGRIKTR